MEVKVNFIDIPCEVLEEKYMGYGVVSGTYKKRIVSVVSSYIYKVVDKGPVCDVYLESPTGKLTTLCCQLSLEELKEKLNERRS